MKIHWGVEVKIHAFLTLTLDGSEWSASPCRIIPDEKPPFPLERKLLGTTVPNQNSTHE
jgi:hypothetical protein